MTMADQGRSLGGSQAADAAEVRRRRLAALGGGAATETKKTASPSSEPASSLPPATPPPAPPLRKQPNLGGRRSGDALEESNLMTALSASTAETAQAAKSNDANGKDDGDDDEDMEYVYSDDDNDEGGFADASNVNCGHRGGSGEADEDEQLRAALALSLRHPSPSPPHKEQHGGEEASTPAADGRNGGTTSGSGEGKGKDEGATSTKAHSASFFDVPTFHGVMWSTSVTTKNDMERWVGQGIDTSPPPPTAAASGDGDAASSSAASGTAKSSDGASAKEDFAAAPSHPLERIGAAYRTWGLTQHHGGPCGILAAVQAEILRLLLFGRRKRRRCQRDGGGKGGGEGGEDDDDDDNDNGAGHWNGARRLFYPAVLPPFDDDCDEGPEGEGKEYVTADLAEEALALSIALILARSAVAPPASASSASSDAKGGGGGDAKGDNGSGGGGEEEPAVRLVLPARGDAAMGSGGGGLSWDDLEPWPSDPFSSSSGTSTDGDATASTSGVRVLTVGIGGVVDNNGGSGSGGVNGAEQALSSSTVGTPESKRQRSSSVTTLRARAAHPWEEEKDGDGGRPSSMSPEQRRTVALATTVARYLLGLDSDGGEGEEVNEENADEESAAAPTTVTSSSRPPLVHFREPGGVMLLVMSLVASRGERRIREDMDDPSNTLTSQFGHSSQELINLLLTGQAVSNVFDNSLTVSGDLTCRGVQRRPAVGYLSQLESLRYCEVGGYFKSPRFPIWVVGSTSHFTVLFGDGRCLRESKSDVLLEKCRRAFKAVDGEENGFIDAPSLGKVIDALKLRDKIGGDHGIQTLAASLEVSGAGIILWDDFWKASSRLLTGASLENVLQGEQKQQENPLLITQYGEGGGLTGTDSGNAVATAASSAQPTMESDEELAKRLAAEWGTDAAGNSAGESSHSAHQAQAGGQGRAKSDEELARELQAQWDAEASGGNSGGTSGQQSSSNFAAETKSETSTGSKTAKSGNATGATGQVTKGAESGNVIDLTAGTTPGEDARNENSKVADAAKTTDGDQSNHSAFDFEKFGDTFPLLHYNGLRGGLLTSFRVTRLSPEEAVGASIALSRHSSGGNGGTGASASRGSGDLEDVVRTKWPSCVFNWGGKHPPYID